MEIKKCPFCGGIGELTMDEKIDELSNEICMGAIDYTTQRDIKPHRNGVQGHIAERLTQKGYRKESDTAREILAEIDDLTLFIVDGSKEFEKGYFQAIADMKTAIKDLLKEKYGVEVE